MLDKVYFFWDSGKALSSVIVMEFLIEILVGANFSRKYKFNFDAMYSVYTE